MDIFWICWDITEIDFNDEETKFCFSFIFVNLIDFVYLMKIMFLEYLYSVIVLTSNITRTVTTATQA